MVYRTDHQTLMSILHVDAHGYTWHCFGSSVGPPPSVHRLMEVSRILSWTNSFVNPLASRQHVSDVVTIRHSLFKIAPWSSRSFTSRQRPWADSSCESFMAIFDVFQFVNELLIRLLLQQRGIFACSAPAQHLCHVLLVETHVSAIKFGQPPPLKQRPAQVPFCSHVLPWIVESFLHDPRALQYDDGLIEFLVSSPADTSQKTP